MHAVFIEDEPSGSAEVVLSINFYGTSPFRRCIARTFNKSTICGSSDEARLVDALTQHSIQIWLPWPLSAQPSSPEGTTRTYHHPSVRRCSTCRNVPFRIAMMRKPIRDVGWDRRARKSSGGLGDYWNDRRFRRKRPSSSSTPDNIYRPVGDRLIQVRNPAHGPKDAPKDTSGRYALILDPAWRLNPEISSLPDQFSRLRLGPHHRRGHRLSEVDVHTGRELQAWLASRALRVRRGSKVNSTAHAARLESRAAVAISEAQHRSDVLTVRKTLREFFKLRSPAINAISKHPATRDQRQAKIL